MAKSGSRGWQERDPAGGAGNQAGGGEGQVAAAGGPEAGTTLVSGHKEKGVPEVFVTDSTHYF